MGDREEHAEVEAGMEILGWRYDAERWHEHQASEVVRRSRDEERRSPLAVGVGVVSGGALLFALLMATQGEWLATGVLAGIALVLSLVWLRHTPRSETHDEDTRDGGPPRVLFTSTGVLFGEQARRWRGDDYRLAFVVVERGHDCALVLEFDGELRTAVWRIPVPAGLEADVEDLATVLHAKTLEDAGLERPLARPGD